MSNIHSVTIADPDFGELVVTAHNANPIDNAEWNAHYLDHVRAIVNRGTTDAMSNIVFAEGKGPNAVQRGEGNAIFGKDKRYALRVSVVTTSMMVRGAVTALSWFNPLIRAFGPNDWQRAAAHVRLTPKHFAMLRLAALQVKQHVPDCDVLNQYLANES